MADATPTASLKQLHTNLRVAQKLVEVEEERISDAHTALAAKYHGLREQARPIEEEMLAVEQEMDKLKAAVLARRDERDTHRKAHEDAATAAAKP